MVGLVGQPNACAYAATKGGIIAMTKNLAIDLATYGIRVNVICPGWIQTPLVSEWFEKQDDPIGARAYIHGKHSGSSRRSLSIDLVVEAKIPVPIR